MQRRHQSPVRVGVAKGRHRLLRSREEGRAVSLSLLERSCAYVLVRKASGRGHSLFSKSCFAHFETRPAARRGRCEAKTSAICRSATHTQPATKASRQWQ